MTVTATIVIAAIAVIIGGTTLLAMAIFLHSHEYKTPIWFRAVIGCAIVAMYSIALSYVFLFRQSVNLDYTVPEWLPLALRMAASSLYIVIPAITWYAFQLIVRSGEYAQLQNQFISNASHELRTPLGIIYGYSELANDGGLATEKQEFAWQQVFKSASRMRWLVENVLGVAKLEAGGNVQMDTVPLTAVIRDVIDSMEEIAQKNNTSLAIGYLSDCQVHGSEPLLFLAISNLVNNAVKFSPGGAVTVSVASTRRVAIISVVDNGIGMSKETQAVAFEKFRQGDGTDTRRFGGTGIGLHFVRLVADFHHGQVTCKSELGKGSTFTMILPLGERP